MHTYKNFFCLQKKSNWPSERKHECILLCCHNCSLFLWTWSVLAAKYVLAVLCCCRLSISISHPLMHKYLQTSSTTWHKEGSLPFCLLQGFTWLSGISLHYVYASFEINLPERSHLLKISHLLKRNHVLNRNVLERNFLKEIFSKEICTFSKNFELVWNYFGTPLFLYLFVHL